jgi:hypothetical protein
VTRLASLLSSLELDHLELDGETLDFERVLHLYESLVLLLEWANATTDAIQNRLGYLAIQRRLAGLRAKTVKNGCSPDEAASAQALADKLEARLPSELVA